MSLTVHATVLQTLWPYVSVDVRSCRKSSNRACHATADSVAICQCGCEVMSQVL